ncbi:hypothetical protein L1857_25310 [Amycolatopsis thermalba]|uniref:Integral membrane protein n=1 Tax=Amycolatopsis thermalba TaxID=944492 RepID=A0ABY4P0P9_9PSEU|nr:MULTISPECIES: hypothetical protein [Amycolatopsis]UQS25889.1 hypothetical protein L1857_25310 [Amycolatopsis thermalba]
MRTKPYGTSRVSTVFAVVFGFLTGFLCLLRFAAAVALVPVVDNTAAVVLLGLLYGAGMAFSLAGAGLLLARSPASITCLTLGCVITFVIVLTELALRALPRHTSLPDDPYLGWMFLFALMALVQTRRTDTKFRVRPSPAASGRGPAPSGHR